MSIFGSIIDKIFKHKPAVPPRPAEQAAPAPAAPRPVAPAAPPPAQPGASAAPSTPTVDVEAVLTEMASLKAGGGGNWRISIVDLLALLDLDHSMSARHDLAEELGIRVGADGTAEQNIALHKAVMKKLAENGGIVPDSMRD